MNSMMRRMIMERQRRREDKRGMDYGRGEYEGEFRGEYDSDYARRNRRRDYAYDDEEDMRDGRRGVKGTGPYGIGGRRYYPSRRRRDYASYDMADDYPDYGDYEYDNARYDRRGRDYAGDDQMKLSKSDMDEWKDMMENADGTHGEHFSLAQIKQVAQALGIQMRNFDEKELCLTVNMLYSDYCDALKQFVPKDKEAMVYTKMAKAFLDDPDASVQGGEKLAAYFYAIVSQD